MDDRRELSIKLAAAETKGSALRELMRRAIDDASCDCSCECEMKSDRNYYINRVLSGEDLK